MTGFVWTSTPPDRPGWWFRRYAYGRGYWSKGKPVLVSAGDGGIWYRDDGKNPIGPPNDWEQWSDQPVPAPADPPAADGRCPRCGGGGRIEEYWDPASDTWRGGKRCPVCSGTGEQPTGVVTQ